MAIKDSGTLRIRADIGAEFGHTPTGIQLNTDFGSYIGKASGTQTRMSDFYGAKASDPAYVGTGTRSTGMSYLSNHVDPGAGAGFSVSVRVPDVEIGDLVLFYYSADNSTNRPTAVTGLDNASIRVASGMYSDTYGQYGLVTGNYNGSNILFTDGPRAAAVIMQVFRDVRVLQVKSAVGRSSSGAIAPNPPSYSVSETPTYVSIMGGVDANAYSGTFGPPSGYSGFADETGDYLSDQATSMTAFTATSATTGNPGYFTNGPTASDSWGAITAVLGE